MAPADYCVTGDFHGSDSDSRLFLCYLPLLGLVPIARTLAIDPNEQFLERFRQSTELYSRLIDHAQPAITFKYSDWSTLVCRTTSIQDERTREATHPLRNVKMRITPRASWNPGRRWPASSRDECNATAYEGRPNPSGNQISGLVVRIIENCSTEERRVDRPQRNDAR